MQYDNQILTFIGMMPCDGTSFVTGMSANTLEYQGGFVDDVAVEDFKVQCDHDSNQIVNGLPFDVPKFYDVNID